jgi:hypothetical protein
MISKGITFVRMKPMIIVVNFSLEMEGSVAARGESRLKQVNLYLADSLIYVNGIHAGIIDKTGGKWSAGGSINKYMPEIKKRYDTMLERYDWKFPADLRAMILWLKVDIDNNSLIIAISDDISLEDFGKALKDFFGKQRIEKYGDIILHHPRFLESKIFN